MSLGEDDNARLPVPLQHVAATAFGVSWRLRRLGGEFPRLRREAAARHELEAEAWEAWRTVRLRDVLLLAWEAPGYRERWQAAGVVEGDLVHATPDELPALLPLLPKDEVRPGALPFCPGGVPDKGAIACDTSGSTGTPVRAYTSRGDFQRSLAIRDAAYDAFAGVSFALPRATFSGRRVVPQAESDGPFHRYNAAERQVYFSPYHLSARTAPAYVAALWAHRPVWITGYATLISDLARHVLELGLPCPPLRAAITAAEPVPEGARELVLAAFGGRLYEEYGLIEDVCVALECEAGSLHVLPDSGVVEIVRADGTPCAPGEVGEIVGTSLIREAQPFVRYRTGDLGALAAEPCACGRPMPVLSALEGRLDDVVLGSDGRRVSRMSVVPKGLAGIRAAQFVQERPGAVTVRVLADGELPADTVDALRQRIRDRVGSDTDVDVVSVDELERTERGKIRGVISRIGRNE